MKKSELTQLTQLIEALVAKEVRKQLPSIIAETFQNMMGKTVVTEEVQPAAQKPEAEELDLKTSLREMFAGTPRSAAATSKAQPVRQQRQFTKDPVLNQILNETTPLRTHERNMGSMPAFLNQYQQPSVAMPNPAEMNAAMTEGEPEFAQRMPSFPVGSPPVLREGQESSHAPMEALPEGVSVLDVAKSGMLPKGNVVTEALTNYGRMKKILDQSRGKRH